MNNILLCLVLVALLHGLKPPFRQRAMVLDGNPFVGIGAALVFTLLSIGSLGCTVAALVLVVVEVMR